MNQAFLDLLGRFPGMREAFDALPDYDRRALCDGLRECVVTPEEQEAIVMARHAGFFLEGGER